MNFNVTCIHMLKILLVFPPIKILMKRKYEASLCANFHLDKNQHLPFFFLFLKRQFLKQILQDKLGKFKTVAFCMGFSLFCFGTYVIFFAV